MASIQEVATAAYRIGQAASEAQTRTIGCADTLRANQTRLAAAAEGSRSGMEAVQMVGQAERATRETARHLMQLQATIDTFIADLTK